MFLNKLNVFLFLLILVLFIDFNLCDYCESENYGAGNCSFIADCAHFARELEQLSVFEMRKLLCHSSSSNGKICCPKTIKTQSNTCGREIPGNSAPWLVGIGKYDKNSFTILCSGALVSKKHVIGSTECIQNADTVLLGTGIFPSNNIEIIKISKSKGHNFWDPNKPLENNIAVYELETPIPNNSKAKSVCMSFIKTNYNHLTISTWNTISGDKVNQQYSSSMSSKALERSNCIRTSITENQICVLYKRTCNNSREITPILTYRDPETGSHALVGVGFHGNTCIPGFQTTISSAVTFTFLPNYERWIFTTM